MGADPISLALGGVQAATSIAGSFSKAGTAREAGAVNAGQLKLEADLNEGRLRYEQGLREIEYGFQQSQLSAQDARARFNHTVALWRSGFVQDASRLELDATERAVTETLDLTQAEAQRQSREVKSAADRTIGQLNQAAADEASDRVRLAAKEQGQIRAFATIGLSSGRTLQRVMAESMFYSGEDLRRIERNRANQVENVAFEANDRIAGIDAGVKAARAGARQALETAALLFALTQATAEAENRIAGQAETLRRIEHADTTQFASDMNEYQQTITEWSQEVNRKSAEFGGAAAAFQGEAAAQGAIFDGLGRVVDIGAGLAANVTAGANTDARTPSA